MDEMMQLLQTLIRKVEMLEKKVEKQGKLAYSTQELANELHTHEKQIGLFRKTGILVGTKVGQPYIYSRPEAERFLRDMKGRDLGTAEKIRKRAHYE